MTILLGIDVGTTALKCAAFDIHGRLLAISTKEYALMTPAVNFVEVDAKTYWQALKDGICDLKRQYDFSNDTLAISFSAQGETLICIDKNGEVLRPAIVWMDNRAQEEAELLKARFGDEVCYEITGQVSFEACWPASKILWLRSHEPEVFKHTDKFLLVEDYLIYRMTAQFATEGSLVCSSTYWNIRTKQYWPEMLEFLGITKQQLPDIYESGVVIGEMTEAVKAEFGQKGRVTVSTGALDQAAGAIGAGNVREGMFSEAIGAALAICVPVAQPKFDPARKMPLHYFAIPDMYMIHTFTTGGMTLRWFRDKFCDAEVSIERAHAMDAYELISAEAAAVAPGSDGLIMLPHLSGSLAPDVNTKAKGVWFGFTLKHTKAHFARAIMEALGYVLRRNIDALCQMGIEVNEIRALGGGSKSPVWNQIKADINHINILTVASKEAACLGAAILAGKSIGVYKSIDEAVSGMISVKAVYSPNPENSSVYDRGYEMYCSLFHDLEKCFDATE